MAKKTYWEKLQDPRWQKKRLQVMERAGFRCEYCGTETKQLHVHHGYYHKGQEPWEHDIKSLWCLCQECHYEFQMETMRLHWLLSRCELQNLRHINGLITGYFDRCNRGEEPGSDERIPKSEYKWNDDAQGSI